MDWIAIVSLVASIVTLLAVWGNISAMWFNCRHFWKGGLREYYPSGSYLIRGNGVNGKVIFKYGIGEGFKRTTEIGSMVRPEIIKPFYKWDMAHWADDIRVPNYPLQLLS